MSCMHRTCHIGETQAEWLARQYDESSKYWLRANWLAYANQIEETDPGKAERIRRYHGQPSAEPM